MTTQPRVTDRYPAGWALGTPTLGGWAHGLPVVGDTKEGTARVQMFTRVGVAGWARLGEERTGVTMHVFQDVEGMWCYAPTPTPGGTTP